ncbi:hypothetical protein EDB87DRAFT_1652250 [Lactarius vividus]|nr:hypothetical protein EDB87DRAFT_1652250 [Lactarius vividus]
MDALRILVDHCGPLMDKIDQIQRFRDARNFKHLSKKTYRMAKRASDRALDNNLRGGFGRTSPASEGVSPPEPLPETGLPGGAPLAISEELDGTDSSARAPPATSEELDGTHPPAGAPPPVTPEEPGRPPPHLGTDSHATLSPGAAGIGGPMDEVCDTYSFIYGQDFASSEASIASYKTERTVNSRKSRYNALPRRKHSDSGYLAVTEGIASLNVNDTSVQWIEVPTGDTRPGPSRTSR